MLRAGAECRSEAQAPSLRGAAIAGNAGEPAGDLLLRWRRHRAQAPRVSPPGVRAYSGLVPPDNADYRPPTMYTGSCEATDNRSGPRCRRGAEFGAPTGKRETLPVAWQQRDGANAF